jgi:hypothetical protein
MILEVPLAACALHVHQNLVVYEQETNMVFLNLQRTDFSFDIHGIRNHL